MAILSCTFPRSYLPLDFFSLRPPLLEETCVSKKWSTGETRIKHESSIEHLDRQSRISWFVESYRFAAFNINYPRANPPPKTHNLSCHHFTTRRRVSCDRHASRVALYAAYVVAASLFCQVKILFTGL